MRIRIDEALKLEISHEFRKMCNEFGFIIDDVEPHSSSQNGSIEVEFHCARF